MFCVGTMSSDTGWETKSVDNAMSKHFYYWFVSRANQSRLLSDIPSFYKLWKDYGERQDEMVSQTQTLLTAYMKELFPTVTVTVVAEAIDGSISMYRLKVNCRVDYNGTSYNLAEVVAVRPDAFTLLDKHRLG